MSKKQPSFSCLFPPNIELDKNTADVTHIIRKLYFGSSKDS